MLLIKLIDLYYSIKNIVCSLSLLEFIQFVISQYYYKKIIEPIGDYTSISHLSVTSTPRREHVKDSGDETVGIHLCCKRDGYYTTKNFYTNIIETPKPRNYMSYFSNVIFGKAIIIEFFYDEENRRILEKCVPTGIVVSHTFFINIEYTHVKLYQPLNIKLSAKYFVAGNEILSDIFVCRYLSYTFGKHVLFEDMNYKLNIIDSNVNIFTIDKNQHIRLSANGYEVRDNEYKELFVNTI